MLGQVPQGDQLSVSFHAHAGPVTEMEHKRRSGAYYPVLAARFHHARLGLSEANDLREHGYYDPKWDIVVYAVSRGHRAVACTLLLDRGLQLFRRLAANAPQRYVVRAEKGSPFPSMRRTKLLSWRRIMPDNFTCQSLP